MDGVYRMVVIVHFERFKDEKVKIREWQLAE
jgi:hypothetical protein